jgi:hypothetical protein
VPCTPEYRAEFNKWAESFFPPDPTLNVVKDGQFFVAGRTVYVNPRTYARIAAAQETQR